MDGMLSQEEINALLGGMGNDDKVKDSTVEDLTVEEKDAIGEISNICMGTAATTLYSLVNQKVVITTPTVTLSTWEEIQAAYAKPCVIINIAYKEGIKGNNILILKEDDVKVIFTEIPHIEIPDDLHKKIIVNEEFFLNREKLKIELLNHKTRASHICNTERKYDSKIFRLLSILKKLKAGKYISSTDFFDFDLIMFFISVYTQIHINTIVSSIGMIGNLDKIR